MSKKNLFSFEEIFFRTFLTVHEKIAPGAIQFHRLWRCHGGLYGLRIHG